MQAATLTQNKEQVLNTQKVNTEPPSVYIEEFDKNRLYHIIKHEEIYRPLMKTHDDKEDPFILSKKILEKSRDGRLKVSHSQHNERGRLFAKNGVSLANLCKNIRHTIAKDLYDDIDIVNAHPIFLRYICKEEGIDHDELDEYIENRDKCLNELDCDRESAKAAYLTIVNGPDNAIDWIKVPKTRNLQRFAKEMKDIRASLIESKAKDFKAHIKYAKSKGREKNFEGSFINMLLCDVENTVLHLMLEYFGYPDHAVLCFDGMMMKKGPSYDLAGCADYIKKKMKLKIQIVLKPMTMGFDIPTPDDYQECLPENIVPFDKCDKYLWSDFLREYDGPPRIYSSYEDLYEELLPKLKKVVAFISLGKGFFVRKMNLSDKMFDVCPANTDLIVKFKITGIGIFPVSQLIKQCTKELVYSYTCVKPDVSLVNPYEFNFWKGYKATAVSEVNMDLIKPMLDLIRTVWACDDEKVYKVILYFLRGLFQCPHKLPNKENAIVLAGDQGVGKEIIIDFISWFVLGKWNVERMSGVDEAVGSFNSHLQGKALCVINEMASTKEEFRSNFDRLKPFITNVDININAKGINRYPVENISSWILISNHDDIMYMERGDRRYTCLRASSVYKGNKKFFQEIDAKCFNDECGKHFYTYIMNLKDEDVLDPQLLGTTTFKEELKEMSMSPPERFFGHVMESRKMKLTKPDTKDDGEDSDDDNDVWYMQKKVSANDLFCHFKRWCAENNEKCTTQTKFGRVMSKLGFEKNRDKSGIVYTFPVVVDS
jgi:hypothetical protein